MISACFCFLIMLRFNYLYLEQNPLKLETIYITLHCFLNATPTISHFPLASYSCKEVVL